jgi:ERO1-like protein beta
MRFNIQCGLLLYFFVFVRAVPDSFLADTLVRENQVQNVLEHQPVKVPACEHTVRSNLPLHKSMN